MNHKQNHHPQKEENYQIQIHQKHHLHQIKNTHYYPSLVHYNHNNQQIIPNQFKHHGQNHKNMHLSQQNKNPNPYLQPQQ